MKRAVGVLIVVCVTTLLVAPSYAQRTDPPVVEQSIKRLEDPEWRTRSAALGALLGSSSEPAESRVALSRLLQKWPEKSDEIKVALIKALEIENKVTEEQEEFILRKYAREGSSKPHPFPDAEARSEFYARLVVAVTSLKDTRSINGLLGAIKRGNMVIRALAEFGSAALDPVVEQLNSSDVTRRYAATLVLAKMVDPKNSQRVNDPVSIQKIAQALRYHSKNDPFEPLRNAASEALKNAK